MTPTSIAKSARALGTGPLADPLSQWDPTSLRHAEESRLGEPARGEPEPGGHRRVGFFTDTSLCIGCKACEVACKEWNHVPHHQPVWSGRSYDNSGKLGADTWRHVTFIEQAGQHEKHSAAVAASVTTTDQQLSTWLAPASGHTAPPAVEPSKLRWLMSSDVCKHCTRAACLEVCPTGALIRTEFGTVVVQDDVCNGCGYCIPACPFGVIDQRSDDGRAWKCTLCYDRLKGDLTPACAQACPTQSIQFGELAELRQRAHERLEQLHEAGVSGVQLYGADENDGVGGMGAFFLLLDDPEVYGLPPDPIVPTRDLGSMWKAAAGAAAALVGAVAIAAMGGRR